MVKAMPEMTPEMLEEFMRLMELNPSQARLLLKVYEKISEALHDN